MNPEITAMDEDSLWPLLRSTVDELLPGLGDARVLGKRSARTKTSHLMKPDRGFYDRVAASYSSSGVTGSH